MAKMNVGKSIAGGVLAGIVLAGFDFASYNLLLPSEWQTVAQLHNIDPALMGGTSALVTMIGVDLVLGQLLVLIYASIRPRFGRGMGTAAIASLMLFLPEALFFATFGGWFVTWDLYFRQTAVLLVSTIAAGLAGGWIYAEEGDDLIE